MILGIFKLLNFILQNIIFQVCVESDNHHSSTFGVATYLQLDGKFHTLTLYMYMFRLDQLKPGENTRIHQSCHVPFGRFLAYPTTTVSRLQSQLFHKLFHTTTMHFSPNNTKMSFLFCICFFVLLCLCLFLFLCFVKFLELCEF